MGDANAQRRVHQKASAGVIRARSSITYTFVATTNNSWIPFYVISTITNVNQFHGLDEEDVTGHVSQFVRIGDTFNIIGVTGDAIYI